MKNQTLAGKEKETPIQILKDRVCGARNLDQGGEEGVSIWIKFYDGSVCVGQIHKRKSIIYAKDSQYNYIPSGLRDYVKNSTFNMESKSPSGVTWMR